ncbi:PH domain-containing protein [Staphylococcus epidermidis]|nr:PH domain-containing protein [Staphylococcus epidermidis]
MKSYKYMHQNGIKVMRISGAFWTLLLVIALSILILLNELKFHFIDTKNLIIGVIILTTIVCILFMIIWFKFKHLRYFLDDKEIHIREGIIFIDVHVIPYFRIQNIDIVEGFIMRKFQLASLSLSTAGGNSEIALIDIQEAQRLKKQIKQQKSITTNVTSLEKLNDDI